MAWGSSVVWAQTGEVVVVTSFPKELFEGYKKAFEAATPGVKVVVKQQQTNQGVTYLRETKAKPDADIFWVSSVDAFLTLKQEGLLDRVVLPQGSGGADSGQRRGLSDSRSGRDVLRLCRLRLWADVEHALPAGQQAAGTEGVGRTWPIRATTATW